MKVAYLTMCFVSFLWPRRLSTVLYQDWPNEDKIHILLHQRSNLSGKFPDPLIHDYPFKVVERKLEGGWPELWALKLWKGIETAKEFGAEIIIILDEDDEYPPDWTRETVKHIKAGADCCWNWYNRDVKRGYMKVGRYNAPGGTMVVKIDVLEKAAKKLRHTFPLGKRHATADGTVDLTLCKILMEICTVVEHKKIREYYRGKFANTKRRPYEDDVDFDFDYAKAVTAKRPNKAKGPNAPMKR